MTNACTERHDTRPFVRECVSGRSGELNRRLKLDLLITAGNPLAVANGSDPAHTLLNLHFVIPTLPFVIVVISGRSMSRRRAMLTKERRVCVFPDTRERQRIIRSLTRILRYYFSYRVSCLWARDDFPSIINYLITARISQIPSARIRI